MERDISAAILSGGNARRLDGIIKPAIIVGGRTIMSRMLSVLADIFSDIMVVSNSGAGFFREYDLKVVPDIIRGKGPLGGIHAALQHSAAKDVFVFAGDMPLIDRSVILEQIGVFREKAPSILVPKAGELIEPLHSIYSKNIAAMLEKHLLEGRSSAVRDFLKDSGAVYFEPGQHSFLKNAFLNINSPGDIVIAEECLRNNYS